MTERYKGFVFVGENRSNTAQKKGWTWEHCQITDAPRLCAIKLFDALEACEIDPTEQIILNILHDDYEVNEPMLSLLTVIAEQGYQIIGMGQKVQQILDKYNVPHKKIIHPAARGKIREGNNYSNHVVGVLLSQENEK